MVMGGGTADVIKDVKIELSGVIQVDPRSPQESLWVGSRRDVNLKARDHSDHVASRDFKRRGDELSPQGLQGSDLRAPWP